ncbi:ganglioside GM2 activator-like [Mercenaria mercenaria]|uniref:ganglioside GM2 activator-like n=1 Tax=Mercenaria mercenaria TaxID=6596 RepID=UPI00234E73C7|nr:ganglioside GM2 activator-like [Mercenaria mercenaria]
MLRAVVLLVIVSTAFALLPFKITDCNTSPNKVVHLDNPTLTNINPIHIPGNETVSIDVQVLQPISGMHYKVELTILKHVLFGFVIVPCYEDPSQNKCTYELCDILSGKHYNNTHHCPIEVASSSPDFECACPFSPGTYHLNPTNFLIGDLPAALKFLAQDMHRVTQEKFILIEDKERRPKTEMPR